MNLSIFSILIFFILLTHDIILVNEESLILICFCVTFSILISKFNYLTDSIFQKYRTHQKEKFVNNLLVLNQILNKVISQNQNKLFLISLIKMKNYWTKFGKNLVYWFGLNLVYKMRFCVQLYFRSIQNNEFKVTKLLNLALNQDLKEKTLLNNFVEKTLLNFKLKAKNLVVVREWIRFGKTTTFLF